jgi:transposase-like protein
MSSALVSIKPVGESAHRYRYQTCQKTFCSNTATPYYRLQHRRATFDQVATLSVEGLNKSAIAPVEHIGWNTVYRWLEKLATAAVVSTIKK